MSEPVERNLGAHDFSAVRGHVRAAKGLTLTAHVPGAGHGDWVRIERRDGVELDAEVIAFDGDAVTLMPFGEVRGIGPDDRVRLMGKSFGLRCSDALLGRVLSGIGRPIDGRGEIEGEPWPITRAAPAAIERPRICRVLPTGVRVIDGLCTVGEGQRIGIFAPAGVGKTMLLGRLAERADVDVIVACLIGERGRELNEFVQDALDESTRARSVIVCATSDAPALERVKSAHVATTVAEYFRARGKRVLLLVDSLTRLVRAARDVGLAAGEPPARRGFPPSAFAELAPLIERTGLSVQGSITAFYAVLVEGNDLDEPVADEVRGLVDGHLVLDRTLAQRGHYPPVDVTRSLSRLMDSLVSPPQREAAKKLRALLAHYELKRDLVELGATQPGADPLLDQALARMPAILSFVRQERSEKATFGDVVEHLRRI